MDVHGIYNHLFLGLVQRTLALMNCHACVWLNKACLGGQ